MKKILLIIFIFIFISIFSFSKKIIIYYTQSASEVSIIGDFTNNIPEQMEKTNTGLWKKVFDLEEGQYKYLFLVDNKEILDYKNLNTVYYKGKIYSLLVVKKEEMYIPSPGDGKIGLINHKKKENILIQLNQGRYTYYWKYKKMTFRMLFLLEMQKF
ncbi:glycogen-binding domain-containing protein [Marinitoga lauensis]|uniref:glycogen-binding domain-containing protein n=1 Tax=Marinitoga lauensis TaxID=2201189 RepID=UPI001F0FC394|nr:glycogen-binding domain-containing protein [Marinitoga lauensis]